MDVNDFEGKISNPAQLGGIETAVLDNGAGRGVRVAWVNTGSPLRFKVVLDRAMDIVDAFHGPHSLAWLSRSGVTPPNPAANQGLVWLRSFGGGLMTTCGLAHVGGPESDAQGVRGLHGLIGNQPAELILVRQPDPERGEMRMAISGIVRETGVFGPHLEMRRTISAELGKAEIWVEDEVVNRGNQAAPHMLLYHCNLGYPLVDEGAELYWKGETRSRGGAQDDAVFAGGHDCHRGQPPLPAHAGAGEACGFIRPEAEFDGRCHAGVRNLRLGLSLDIEFDKNQLPCLANWQHWGRGEYVTGLEPGTHFPVGQGAARRDGNLILLEPGEPGESRRYALVFRVGSV